MLGMNDIRAAQRLQYNGHWFLEHLFGDTLLASGAGRALFEAQKRALRERIRKTMSRKGAGRVFEIDERNDLGPEEFVRDYLSQARPVVMRGVASSWECCKSWTPSAFAERYGDDRVLIIHLEQDWNEDHSTEETNLREVIGSMGTGVMRYARFVPLLKNHPELFDHFDRNWIESYVGHEVKLWGRPGAGVPLRSQLFIGEKGTKTSLHCAMTNNLFVQAYGEKQWILYPPSYNPVLEPPVTRAPGFFACYYDPTAPDLATYPASPYMDRYELHLKPGDVFYNPPFHWHHVSNPTDSIGIGIRWYWKVSARKSCWTQNRLSFMATNPTMQEFLRNGDDFAYNFGKTRAVGIDND